MTGLIESDGVEMNSEKIRARLNLIDFQILKLLNTRIEIGLKAKKLNGSAACLTQESDVLAKISNQSDLLIDPQFCENLFKDIFSASARWVRENFQLIGFQGEHGAYSEVAAKTWNQDLIPLPCSEFTEVFEGVTSGLYDFGIVPVENTLGGVVSQVNQLILQTDLFVVGAIELPIHHCLLALPGSDLRELRVVYSHYQALEQCHNFLVKNKLEAVPFYDTAGAAKMLAETSPKATAVIASRYCADYYNLKIIKENIEDFEQNITRFLIFSRKEHQTSGQKCSIVFSTAHKAGTLFKVLEVFANAGINLTRIESIPNRQGSYAFFLDFVGSQGNEKIIGVLEEVKKITTHLKILGFYDEFKGE